MPLDIYFQSDITQAIVAVVVSSLTSARAHGGGNVEYCRGVLDACRAQALVFGIPPAEVWQIARDGLGMPEILDAVMGELEG